MGPTHHIFSFLFISPCPPTVPPPPVLSPLSLPLRQRHRAPAPGAPPPRGPAHRRRPSRRPPPRRASSAATRPGELHAAPALGGRARRRAAALKLRSRPDPGASPPPSLPWRTSSSSLPWRIGARWRQTARQAGAAGGSDIGGRAVPRPSSLLLPLPSLRLLRRRRLGSSARLGSGVPPAPPAAAEAAARARHTRRRARAPLPLLASPGCAEVQDRRPRAGRKTRRRGPGIGGAR